MTTLPPQFNFPGAQQGIPQGIFSLVQSMAGMGPGGAAQTQAPFNNTTFSNTLASIMQPRAPMTTGATLPNTLPPMPAVTKAPVVESRNPVTPIAPVGDATTVDADEMKNYLHMLAFNTGDTPGQRSERNNLLRNPPKGMEWRTNESGGVPISRSLVRTSTPKAPVKTGGSK